MHKLKLVAMEDPILRKRCVTVSQSELRSEEFQSLIDQMMSLIGDKKDEISKKRNKIRSAGLAANQVGLLQRLIVADMAFGKSNCKNATALINPTIIWESSSTNIDRETCLTLPKKRAWTICGLIKRSKKVKVGALDRYGTYIEIHAQGLLARLLQHEIDHLHGILFIDHLPDFKKAHYVPQSQFDEYRRNYRTWNQYVDVSPWARKRRK